MSGSRIFQAERTGSSIRALSPWLLGPGERNKDDKVQESDGGWIGPIAQLVCLGEYITPGRILALVGDDGEAGGVGHDVICILHRSLWLCKKWNLGRGRILVRGYKAICKRELGAETGVLIMKMEKWGQIRALFRGLPRAKRTLRCFLTTLNSVLHYFN